MTNPNFKPQRGRTRRDRKPERELVPLPSILIVCQGEKTEPNYFRAFRVADVEILHGNGDPRQVVEFAEAEYDKDTRRDQVWCVFDRDDFPQFDLAVSRVGILQQQGKPFFAAWSNACFELWYVLHFEYLQSAIDRDRYGRKITQHLQISYKKNDDSIRDRLKMHEHTALQNAARLRKMHDDAGTVLPSRRCPMTTVDELVVILQRARAV